jgi:hypothetical protein
MKKAAPSAIAGPGGRYASKRESGNGYKMSNASWRIHPAARKQEDIKNIVAFVFLNNAIQTYILQPVLLLQNLGHRRQKRSRQKLPGGS